MYKRILNNLVGNQPNLNVDTKVINELMKQQLKEVLLRPGFPPLYLTTKSKTTQYTTQQLQVIK